MAAARVEVGREGVVAAAVVGHTHNRHSPTTARTETAAGVRYAATLNYVLLSSESHGATLNSAQIAWSNAELYPNRMEQGATQRTLIRSHGATLSY